MKHLVAFLFLGIALSSAVAQSANSPLPNRFYFGTVNFQDQLTHPETWQQSIAAADGMLLHGHFFLKHLSTPSNAKVADADAIIAKIAPSLAGKNNVLEEAFHIHPGSSNSPEEIARSHVRDIEDLQRRGIPVSALDVDWILSIFDVVSAQVPAETPQRGEVILQKLVDLSARYVKAFRATGHQEALYLIFPPLYMDEGRWINARKVDRYGITTSRLISNLFAVGFAGYTADSPYSLITNRGYENAGYWEALHSIACTCQQNGKSFGFIVNGNNGEAGDAYDAKFEQDSLAELRWLESNHIHPDRLIFESWYKGPYTLTPESKSGSFTHAALLLNAEYHRWKPE